MMKSSGASQRILASALDLLTQWENASATLDSCLDDLRGDASITEKAAVASLLFEYFRHKGFIDSLIHKHAKKDAIRQDMRLLLCCAMTQVLFQTGIASQSAVNIAVDHAKRLRGQGGGGFINAMLRSMLRDTSYDRAKIPPSFPDALRERWTQALGTEQAEQTIARYASNPPLSFRVRGEVPEAELAAMGATPLSGCDFAGKFRFYEITDPAPLFRTNWIEQGLIYIQDPATVMGMSLLDTPPAGRILDACAAPGGKTILIHDSLPDPLQARITAADRSSARLIQMNQNLRRAGVRCRSLEAEAQNLPFSPASFDFILADLPCSNTGVIRRRPDAPWRFHPKRMGELVVLQKQILDALANLLKPGGTLLYSTCSVEPDEDAVQMEAFLLSHAGFTLQKQRLLLPSEHHDGAYAAVLKKALA